MSVSSSPIATTIEADSRGLQSNASSTSSEDDSLSSEDSTNPEADTDLSGHEQSTATRLCKKRKSETWAEDRRKKRYNDQYRQLLNDTINTAVGESDRGEYERALPSQHVVSRWTADEKAIMFNALARKGENDIRVIAAAVRTKSEMEVRVYLQSIRKALEMKLRQPRADRLSLIDIPAAAEIGEECCYVLDQHAQSLSSLQQVHEEKLEQQKHAELWLLTHDIAGWVEDRIADEGLEGADIRGRLPAVSLLNLPRWLELSRRIFMNPASPREDENWQVIAEGIDGPSIMNTAFTDFHTLALSVTKRLVQSSLFYAMSRLRATDSSRYRYRPVVRVKDVRVAVQVLGMKATAYDFWTRASRRCNLQIYRSRGKNGGRVENLNYDQVERLLRREEIGERHQDRPIDHLENNFASHEFDNKIAPASTKAIITEVSGPRASCQSSSFTGSNGSSSTEGEGEIESDQGPPSKQRRAQRQLERDEDEFVEKFDQQISQAEEERIWALLGETPTSRFKAENIDLPKRPDIRGRLGPNLVQWRDNVEFWSDWEGFNAPTTSHSSGHPRMEIVGLHNGVETSEDEALLSSGRYVKAETRDAEVDEGLEAESAEIDLGNDATTEYTAIGSANDDFESTTGTSEDGACRADLVDIDSEPLAHNDREDRSLSPGSAYEDQTSMELDVDS